MAASPRLWPKIYFPGVVPLIALLAGCAQPSTLERSSLNGMVPEGQAIALPPPGGPAVLGVVERRYANAIQQDIVLAADSAVPGQNFLRVQLFGPVGTDGGQTELPDRPLANSGLNREMREALPGIAMRTSPLYAQNSYGPFGYAIGRNGVQDLCIYGWQRIASTPVGGSFMNRGRVQVRLRLCQSGATEQTLLASMYGYTINTSFSPAGWNPYGSPPPVDPRLGTTGQVIQPVAVVEPPVVVASPSPAPVRRRVAAPSMQTATPARAEPLTQGPVVPPPPGDTEIQRAPVVPPPPAP